MPPEPTHLKPINCGVAVVELRTQRKLSIGACVVLFTVLLFVSSLTIKKSGLIGTVKWSTKEVVADKFA